MLANIDGAVRWKRELHTNLNELISSSITGSNLASPIWHNTASLSPKQETFGIKVRPLRSFLGTSRPSSLMISTGKRQLVGPFLVVDAREHGVRALLTWINGQPRADTKTVQMVTW